MSTSRTPNTAPGRVKSPARRGEFYAVRLCDTVPVWLAWFLANQLLHRHVLATSGRFSNLSVGICISGRRMGG
jgi:hypothetical protein